MNLERSLIAPIRHVFQFWLTLRRLLPRQKCQTFGVKDAEKGPRIEKIYVINLDREPGRWSKIRAGAQAHIGFVRSGTLKLD